MAPPRSPSTLNFSTPLFCPLRTLPPAALLNTPAVPARLATYALIPIVAPVLEKSAPRTPVPELLNELPLTPMLVPVVEVALP